MRPLAKRFGNDLVCVVGMHKVKDVAEHYGFTNVVCYPITLPLEHL